MELAQTRKPLTPGKISLLYVLLSWLWTLFSEPVLHNIIQDNKTLIYFAILKDWFLALVTAIFFYILIRRSWHALQDHEKMLQDNYQALEAAHEELVATEEQLQWQLAESKRQQEFYQGIYDGIADGVILQNGYNFVKICRWA